MCGASCVVLDLASSTVDPCQGNDFQPYYYIDYYSLFTHYSTSSNDEMNVSTWLCRHLDHHRVTFVGMQHVAPALNSPARVPCGHHTRGSGGRLPRVGHISRSEQCVHRWVPGENLAVPCTSPLLHCTCASILFVLISVYTLCTGENVINKFRSKHKYGHKRAFKMLMLTILILNAPLVAAPTTRGGDTSTTTPPPQPGRYDLPNMQRDWDFLPGMKRWNGVPFHDFIRVWWVALCIALGSISQDGNTLLQTAEGTDAADATSTDAETKRKYVARSARVFACISNYLKPHCRPLQYARK